MASSKTSSRRAAPKKVTSRRASSPTGATRKAATAVSPAAGVASEKKSTQTKTTNVSQATKGQIVSENIQTPPTALIAGQDPSPVVVVSAEAENEAQALSKKELIDLAVLRSGVKKKDAKPVVEAVLAILGETIAEGRDLNLKPFGKLRINRSEARGNGTVHICRLRQPLQSENVSEESTEAEQESAPSPLAEVTG